MKSMKIAISKMGQRHPSTTTTLTLHESHSLYYQGLLITFYPECLYLVTSDNFELQLRPHHPGSHILTPLPTTKTYKVKVSLGTLTYDINEAESPEAAQEQARKMFINDHPGRIEPKELVFEPCETHTYKKWPRE